MNADNLTPVQRRADDLYEHLADVVAALDGAHSDPTLTAAKALLTTIDTEAFDTPPGPYEIVRLEAQKVIDNYALEMSGFDDPQVQALMALGDSANKIIELVNEHAKLHAAMRALADENWLDHTGTETPYLAAAKEAARDALGVEP